MPALTWDGIQGLCTIHPPREWDVYNLTSTFHPVSSLQESTCFPENPSLLQRPLSMYERAPLGDFS